MKILLSKKTRDVEAVIYLILFSIYLLFNRIVPITYIFDPINGLLFSALAGFGCLLILQDVLTDQYLFKVKFSWVLILFLVALTVSNVLNIQYGWTDNLKTTIWFCIHFFVVYTISLRIQTEKNKNLILLVFKLFNIVFSICIFISILQFVFQIQYYGYMHFDVLKRQAFVEARLFGVFSDPNAAAMISIWMICINYYLIRQSSVNYEKYFYSFIIIIDFIYIVLSGSRTAEIVLFLIIILGFCLHIHNLTFTFKGCIKKKVIQYVIIVLLFFPVIFGVKSIASYVPEAFENAHVDEILEIGKTEPLDSEKVKKKDILKRDDVSEDNFFNNRFQIWKGYLTSLKDGKWLFGLSPRNALAYIVETYPNNYIAETDYIAHSDYLAIIAYTGLAGFAVFVLLAVLILQYVFKKIRVKKKLDDFYIMSLLIVFSILVYGLSYRDILFCNTFTGFVFWLFMSYILNVKDDGIYEKDSTPSV